MPASLTEITQVVVHVGAGGVADVAVWFTGHQTPGEMLTFNCFDIFDYETFCSRVLEITGHPFCAPEVEEAPDPWTAKVRWRRCVRERLEAARVEVRPGAHWRPLLERAPA